MTPLTRMVFRCALLVWIASFDAAVSQDYYIDWHTVDGGGEMWSTGGAFELGGTIGQPDAGAMTGGTYSLTGGFWAVGADVCTCPSDVNADGLRDGIDVAGFVACFVATGVNCVCADVDGIPGLDLGDVAVFVADLLAGTACL